MWLCTWQGYNMSSIIFRVFHTWVHCLWINHNKADQLSNLFSEICAFFSLYRKRFIASAASLRTKLFSPSTRWSLWHLWRCFTRTWSYPAFIAANHSKHTPPAGDCSQTKICREEEEEANGHGFTFCIFVLLWFIVLLFVLPSKW